MQAKESSQIPHHPIPFDLYLIHSKDYAFRMQHQEFEAPEELQDIIKCFWYNRRDFAEEPTSFEVIPDGYAEIIFYFGSSCSLADKGELQPLPSPFMVGLLNQPLVFKSQNRLEILAIRCFPWTVFDFLGLPSGKDEVRLFKHPIAQLQAGLNQAIQANRLDQALAQLRAYCLQAGSQMGFDSTVAKAGAALREAKGTLPVSQVAEAAYTTVRTLERKFKDSSGYSIKDVSGLIRFEQVRNQLWRSPNSRLAELADELGYTDQAHLSREFKRYSGTTPAAFARKAKREQQALSQDFVAFIQA